MSKASNETFVVAAVLHRSVAAGTEVLIVRRGPAQKGAGSWEFPGGKVEDSESPEQALYREIQEELGVSINVGPVIGEILHAYPEKMIRLRLFWAKASSESLVLHEHDDFKWLLPQSIAVADLSEADRPFVAKIIEQVVIV